MTINTSRIVKIALFAMVVAAVLLTLHFDLLSYLTLENIEALRKVLGWWAPIVFLLAFTVGELVHIPSVLWIFFAGIIWPTWLALPIALASALAAAACSFLVARYFLGHQFHEKLPQKFQRVTQRLEQTPLRGIILIRLTTFLHPIMHWVLAASPVGFTTFLLGTLIGILPMTLAIVLMGEVFLAWWDQYSTYIIGFSVLAIIAFVLHLKRNEISEESSNSVVSE